MSYTEKKSWYHTTKICGIIPWKLPWYDTMKIVVLYLEFLVLSLGLARGIIPRNAWYNAVQFVHSPTPYKTSFGDSNTFAQERVKLVRCLEPYRVNARVIRGGFMRCIVEEIIITSQIFNYF